MVGTSRTADAPYVRLVRFEQGADDQYAVFQFVNPTDRPVFYFAHVASCPMHDLEQRSDENWKPCGFRWCGSGMTLHELSPGNAVQFHGVITRDGDYSPFFWQPIADREELRVGTYYRFEGQEKMQRVTGIPFRSPF